MKYGIIYGSIVKTESDVQVNITSPYVLNYAKSDGTRVNLDSLFDIVEISKTSYWLYTIFNYVKPFIHP